MNLLRFLRIWGIALAVPGGVAFGQTVTPVPSAGAASKSASDGRFSLDALDRMADPCVDFYQYACGGWQAKNPIPSDRSRWGSFDGLAERNQNVLHEILEKVAVPSPGRSPLEAKVGDYYAACMDEQGIEARGLTPLAPELSRIAALKTKADLAEQIAHMHLLGLKDGTQFAAQGRQKVLFDFQAAQDDKDATQVIAVADAGGIGLPDRDDYFRTDPTATEKRVQYLAHVQKMFELAGDKPAQAAANARVVMDIEVALAKVSLTRTDRRDPQRLYHKMPLSELEALSPSFPWKRYLAAVGIPNTQTLNVHEPDFFKGLEVALKAHTLDQWKTYLRWHLLHFSAPLLPKALADESFDFYQRKLTGAKEQRARWKRCVAFTDVGLGEVLGQLFVDRTFGEDGKKRMLTLVVNLEKALEKDIQGLDWMGDETKRQAIAKLKAIENKIGSPEKPRDYASVKPRRDAPLGNLFAAGEYDLRWQLGRIGKPVDKGEWQMSPPTVNAYYDPQMNNINFPAGILQPPFFDRTIDDAVNYGAIGGVIGHELTHGFDDQGRQYDPAGNLRDWWTPEDGKRFEERAACLVKEYNGFSVIKDPKDPKNDVNLNGKLTLGENAADNGGLRIAYLALMESLQGKKPAAGKIDGFTPEQRVFLGWGQVWCANYTDAAARRQALTNEHSVSKYRVNGVVQNMPEFQRAFGCKTKQPMVPENACRIW
ncbi:MAG TPA: M13 family metallopeptidase [Polyangia bacterium]|nr:M13 family metallopeptidase [Polyangia bacterium]